MWCPRERRIHTYIHCSVSWSWSPVWCIYVSLVHWYALSLTLYLYDHLLDMVFILNTHHNRTSFTNDINICNFETFCVLLIYLCTWNTVMFLLIYMLISPCLVLKIYSWACTKSCFFKNIIFNIWKSSLCCWVVKWMICQNVCGQSTLNYSSLFTVHEASVLMQHNESFALFLRLSVGHPIFLSFIIRSQIT